MLCDASELYCTNFFNIGQTSGGKCTISKYHNNTLISNEVIELSSEYYFFQYDYRQEDYSQYNYILYKIEANEIKKFNTYNPHRIDGVQIYSEVVHPCLEISGKCKSCIVGSLGASNNSVKFEKLKYFSFKGNKHNSVGSMFYNCTELLCCPELDEINSGSKQNDNFDTIFYYCKKILFQPNVNTSNCIRGNNAFSTSNIKNPNLDLTNVTSGSYLFEKYDKLPEEFDLTKITDYSYLFYRASFSDEEFRKLDNLHITKSKCDNFICDCVNLLKAPLLIFDIPCSVNNFCSYCKNLIEVPEIDMSNITSLSNSFYNCYFLKKMRAKNIKVSFSLSYCKFLEHDELVIILNNLANVETTQKLTLGSTNLAKLSDEEKAIATSKGWTLA